MPAKRRLSTSEAGNDEEDQLTSAAPAAANTGNSGAGAPEPGKKKRKVDVAQQIQV